MDLNQLYACNLCNYTTARRSQLVRHFLSRRHELLAVAQGLESSDSELESVTASSDSSSLYDNDSDTSTTSNDRSHMVLDETASSNTTINGGDEVDSILLTSLSLSADFSIDSEDDVEPGQQLVLPPQQNRPRHFPFASEQGAILACAFFGMQRSLSMSKLNVILGGSHSYLVSGIV